MGKRCWSVPRYFADDAMKPESPSSNMGRAERAVWQAAIAALLVHAVALGVLEYWGRLPAPERQAYAEVDFVDFEETETRTLEEAVREQMEARLSQIRNAAADSRADRSDEVRSSRAEEARMAAEVEAELRALEQQTFDALADGRDAPDVPQSDDRAQDRPLEDYEGWDARYDGQVTAEFDLAGRQALSLDIPGYRCRGGGVVVLDITVSPGGEVVEVGVRSARSSGAAALTECLQAESLRSARQCRFAAKAGAPKRQSGTLTYRFIAQ